MGSSNSRPKRQMMYNYPMPQPGPIPPPGAFYPQANYGAYPAYPAPGQHLVVPYPYIQQPTMKKRRTRRRRPSVDEAARRDYITQAPPTIMPVPETRETRPPPEPLANFPSEPAPHRGRAQTPYHATVPPPDSEEEEIIIPHPPAAPPSVSQHQRTQSENPNPPRPSAFDLPLRPPNPLPAPPRDLFDSDAYKAVLNIPRGTDLLTALYGYQRDQPALDPDASPQRTRTGLFGRKNSKGGGGLFRSLTGTRGRKQPLVQEPHDIARDRIRAGDVRLVPFPVPVERVTGVAETEQPQQSAFQHVPPEQIAYAPATLPGAAMPPDPMIPPPPLLNEPPFPVMTGPGAAQSQPRPPSAPPQPQQPMQPMQPLQSMFAPEPPLQPRQPQPPLIFTQSSQQYQGFFPHSPHRIMYQNTTYPTATHLHEALKYLPSHPTIADQIRLCLNLAAVYPLSTANQKYVRTDWGAVFLDEMEKILELKFRQHPELRDLLIEGVEGMSGREIVYRDERDGFWGDGGGEGRGANELGRILGRVRDLLIGERERGLRQDGGNV